MSSLPADLQRDVFDCQVDRSLWEKQQGGPFKFFDAQTFEFKYATPSYKRLRVQREKLRYLLMRDLPILWNKRFVGCSICEDGVMASFDDGTTYKGCLLIGADGLHSQVRKFVTEKPDITPLPIRMLGTKVVLSGERAHRLQAVDPLFFVGMYPAVSEPFERIY